MNNFTYTPSIEVLVQNSMIDLKIEISQRENKVFDLNRVSLKLKSKESDLGIKREIINSIEKSIYVQSLIIDGLNGLYKSCLEAINKFKTDKDIYSFKKSLSSGFSQLEEESVTTYRLIMGQKL